MDLRDIHPSSPMRPVDWRWKRAQWLRARALEKSFGPVDRWTEQALRFRELFDSCHGDPAVLAERVPDLAVAHRIWLAQDQPVRWLLEARLLTDAPFAVIAERFAMTTAAVEAYEAWFYDVRRCLSARDYIAICAIGACPLRGIAPRQIDVLWKIFAYYGGPDVLDAAVAPFFAQQEAGKRPDVATIVAEASRLLLSLKEVTAAWTLRVDSRNALRLMRLCQQQRELELRRARQTSAPGNERSQPGTPANHPQGNDPHPSYGDEPAVAQNAVSTPPPEDIACVIAGFTGTLIPDMATPDAGKPARKSAQRRPA